MGWRNAFRRQPEHRGAQFPVHIELPDVPLHVTIYSHEIDTRAGIISVWTYVTHSMSAWQHKEIIFSLKREPDESPADFPDDPIIFFKSIVPQAQAGKFAVTGTFTNFGPDGFMGGQIMYKDPDFFPGLEISSNALTAVLISHEEFASATAYGPTRTMVRLGRTASHYPCPSWSDRERLEDAAAVDGGTWLAQIPPSLRFFIPGLGTIYDRTSLRIRMTGDAHAYLQRLLEAWTLDQPLILFTTIVPGTNGCLVWKAGLKGLNAITPPNTDGSHLAGCYLALLLADTDDFIIVEDGFSLLLTRESGAALRDAFIAGSPLQFFTAKGVPIIVDPVNPPAEITQPQIVLLHPDEVMEARLPDPTSLGRYIDRLLGRINAAVQAGMLPTTFDVWVVACPQHRSRIWIAASGQETALTTVRNELQSEDPCPVESLPIAFLVCDPGAPTEARFPKEWLDVSPDLGSTERSNCVPLDDVLVRIAADSPPRRDDIGQ